MTRDELERCAAFLKQGLDLDKATQKRLVQHALGDAPAPHLTGCAFHRGEGCTCRGEPPPSLPGYRWNCLGCGLSGGPYENEQARDAALDAHVLGRH